jgi:hypothetical protein
MQRLTPSPNVTPEQHTRSLKNIKKKATYRKQLLESAELRTHQNLVFGVWDTMIDDHPYVIPPYRPYHPPVQKLLVEIIPMEILDPKPKLKRRHVFTKEEKKAIRAKIKATLRAHPYHCSEETREKMRAVKQNMSEETKEKIRQANLGKHAPHTKKFLKRNSITPTQKWHSRTMFGRKKPLKKPYIKYSVFTGDEKYRFRSSKSKSKSKSIFTP